MSATPDVVVVGGGIVGLCVALAVADRGMKVTVVDDNRAGAASRASAGMLGPSLPGLSASLRGLALGARDLYPEVVERLAVRSDVAVALDRSGILEVAASSAELDELHRRNEGAARLDQRALAALEPALRAHAGAVHHPHDGWVDNRALMDALWSAADKDPRVHLVRDRAESVNASSGAVQAVLSSGMRVQCRRIVIASGAWTRLSGLPRRIPVRPVKGELIMLDCCPVRHTVYGTRGYLVPRGDTLLVGATSEEENWDPRPSADGLQILLAAASALSSNLSNAKVVDHWGGIRPVSPDGLPILGEAAGDPALVYACGFSRNGMLLAPWAGSALGALLSGEVGATIPPEFSPDRFAK